MSLVLVINSGSSSLKYRLVDVEQSTAIASGLVERIGADSSPFAHSVGGEKHVRAASVTDHDAAFACMLEAFATHGPSLETHAPVAVGHRVVQGGARFFEPTLVTPLVKINIDELSALAPLHNPANLQGIESAERAFPSLPHVAIFDTAFHQTMPDAAAIYAIDRAVAEKHRVRRYGFHGTSHRFVSRAAAEYLGWPVEELRMIVLHLGNGASACAVSEGRSVDTSMGMTPLEGLVMGTRSGDIDPAVLLHLQRRGGMSVDDVDELLNRRSGLQGLAGNSDVRDVVAAHEAGDADATLALEITTRRIRSYVGAYAAQLGRVDAIVFTAGVGENSPLMREWSLAGLEGFGVELDAAANAAPARSSVSARSAAAAAAAALAAAATSTAAAAAAATSTTAAAAAPASASAAAPAPASASAPGARRISTPGSRTAVLVVPTDEELEIARQSLGVVAR